MKETSGFGPHIMLDLHQCNSQLLSSIDLCFELLHSLPNQIGMTKITQPYVFPYEGLIREDKGITGMVIIAESHISVHTFPLKEYAFIDVFSCKPFNTDIAIQYCIDLFKCKQPDIQKTMRGKHFPVGSCMSQPDAVSHDDYKILS